ncbi:MAG: hypothetical protein KKB05_01600 [Proteobacteria bacterium]|nr:hypothetical protein [Pseudomonadota bacterium]
MTDDHADQWDHFSWFGFRQVLISTDDCSICKLRELASVAAGEPATIIRDVEALLIRAMGLNNIEQTKFSEADEWTQVKAHETDYYLKKVAQVRMPNQTLYRIATVTPAVEPVEKL